MTIIQSTGESLRTNINVLDKINVQVAELYLHFGIWCRNMGETVVPKRTLLTSSLKKRHRDALGIEVDVYKQLRINNVRVYSIPRIV